ncbi:MULTISPECIES: hypothetical protein [unclassified Rhizobacter]|uniref:hypothetical protein n=1 Tax=unclassified Rhizobacter TaxID=2640088 RepID=UPI0006FDD900|nr:MULTISPECIES: hypothetical protein [unclassified Rhizobacter]KQU74607.1 hypothetical protein ASC88_27070 [Rhizobacter sp. Root29]KQW13436.1 hypothetical protein ASC98_17995 [Rhizobacter sp. Root1238]KRB23069.1 hypothetical protein ASE08_20460 [Rhizobacter sp. Root16D2]
MNPTTSFELLSTGNEFETASEEFERGWRGGRSGGSQRRRPPSQRRSPPRPSSRSSSWGGYGPAYGPAPWPAWGGPGSPYQRCMQQCLASPYAVPEPVPAADPGPGPAPDAPSEEMTMHPYRCRCPQCGGAQESFEFAAEGEGEGEGEYEGEFEYEGEGEAGSPFSEAEEIALAAELLSVSSEAELEQFLGKLWKGVKKVAGTVSKIAKPFSGVLKAVAKKALPFVGGALGSLIPIPGVGTALGTALGSAVSSALEMEFEGLELEDREFEMARRFVRIAGTAAQQATDSTAPAEFEAAVAAAAQQHLPHFSGRALPGRPLGGRWTRRGAALVLHGV